MSKSATIDRWDIVFFVGLFLILTLYVLSEFSFSARPLEDAAILLRYSKHVAEGHGVVWNIGEPPVEGATDFLFMIVLACFHAMGFSLEFVAMAVGFFSHVTVMTTVYAAIRWTQGLNRSYAMLSSTYIAFGPGLAYIQAQFGTPFFAAFASLTFVAALRCLDNPRSRFNSASFAVSCLVLGLIRPDGVLLGVTIFAGLLWVLRLRGTSLLIKDFVLVFVLPGLLYFLWRWEYFGYLLPNPMYRKGDLWPGSLLMAFSNVLKISFPFNILFFYWVAEFALTLLFRLNSYDVSRTFRRVGKISFVLSVLGLLRTSSPANSILILERYSPLYAVFLLLLCLIAVMLLAASKKISPNLAFSGPSAIGTGESAADSTLRLLSKALVFPLVPIIGFTFGWGFLSHEMDFLMRYEYAVLPIVLMSWPKLASLFAARVNHIQFSLSPFWIRLCSVLLLTILLITTMIFQKSEYSPRLYSSVDIGGRYRTAMELQKYKNKGYSIAGSETGNLPFYSEWRAIDTWGLNDTRIAHDGQLTAEYLSGCQPHVIMFYAPVLQQAPKFRPTQWDMMIGTLRSYAESRNYELAAVYGVSPLIADHYYVRRDFKDSEAIVQTIRGISYMWKGQISFDFRGFTAINRK